MNSDYVQRGPRDGFAVRHSWLQQQVIFDAAFGQSRVPRKRSSAERGSEGWLGSSGGQRGPAAV